MDSIRITETKVEDEHFTDIKIVGAADEKEATKFIVNWCETHNSYLTDLKKVEDYFIARVGSDDDL